MDLVHHFLDSLLGNGTERRPNRDAKFGAEVLDFTRVSARAVYTRRK